MSLDDVGDVDPSIHRDRREHGGAPTDHLDDDALARRTQEERVEAGIADYDPDAVPPASDAQLPYDESADEGYQETAGEVRRQASEGELYPTSEKHPSPPTRYDD